MLINHHPYIRTYPSSTYIQAAYVSTLVERIGLIGSLCTAALIIGSSAMFADKAYQIAKKYGFEPKHDLKQVSKTTSTSTTKNNNTNIIKGHHNNNGNNTNTNPKVKTNTNATKKKDENMIKTSIQLFKRVPILGAMFCEVIVAQCLSSLLNFQFITEVKNTILNDEERAGFTGNVS